MTIPIVSYFISDQDLYERTYKKIISKPIKDENIIDDYSNLKVGDYIVHNDHGIGKYNGLKSKIFNEYLTRIFRINLSRNDKLTIPVENFNLISKYGHGDISVL